MALSTTNSMLKRKHEFIAYKQINVEERLALVFPEVALCHVSGACFRPYFRENIFLHLSNAECCNSEFFVSSLSYHVALHEFT